MENLKNKEEYSFIPQKIKKLEIYNPPIFLKNGYRLDMNENLYGPTPRCIEAFSKITPETLKLYTNKNIILEEAIEKELKIKRQNLIINNGASDLLKQIIEIAVEKEDGILLPKIAWSYYTVISQMLEAKIYTYNLIEKENQYEFSVEDIIESIQKHNPKIVIITSPNMPTGNLISNDNLEKILKIYSNRGILILDQAYKGFSKKDDIKEIKLIEKYDNLVIARTLSKLYGLAALRVGFGICNEKLKKIIEKNDTLFGIPYTSQVIAAEALKDHKYYKEIAEKIINIRENFIINVNRIKGFKAIQSEGNFLIIKIKDYSADKIIKYLLENKYYIRNCNKYGLKNSIRISIGKEENMNEILRLLREYKEV